MAASPPPLSLLPHPEGGRLKGSLNTGQRTITLYLNAIFLGNVWTDLYARERQEGGGRGGDCSCGEYITLLMPYRNRRKKNRSS